MREVLQTCVVLSVIEVEGTVRPIRSCRPVGYTPGPKTHGRSYSFSGTGYTLSRPTVPLFRLIFSACTIPSEYPTRAKSFSNVRWLNRSQKYFIKSSVRT